MENDIKIKVDFYNGCKVEILGLMDKVYPVDDLYRIEFFNNKTGKLIYSTEITPNHWTKPDIFYFIEWRIFVYKNNEKILNQVINLKNEEVLIAIGFNSLLFLSPLDAKKNKSDACKKS